MLVSNLYCLKQIKICFDAKFSMHSYCIYVNLNVALEEQLMSQDSKVLPSHYFRWIVFEVFENRIYVAKSSLLLFI